jgi:hypothetical protein
MEEDRMPKKIFTQELEGTRRRGRHRKRWKEEVERDHVLGVGRWKGLVADRKKWKDIFRQAKANSGLQCQWMKKGNVLSLYSSNHSSTKPPQCLLPTARITQSSPQDHTNFTNL